MGGLSPVRSPVVRSLGSVTLREMRRKMKGLPFRLPSLPLHSSFKQVDEKEIYIQWEWEGRGKRIENDSVRL